MGSARRGKDLCCAYTDGPRLPLGTVENFGGIRDKAAPIKSIVLSFLC